MNSRFDQESVKSENLKHKISSPRMKEKFHLPDIRGGGGGELPTSSSRLQAGSSSKISSKL